MKVRKNIILLFVAASIFSVSIFCCMIWGQTGCVLVVKCVASYEYKPPNHYPLFWLHWYTHTHTMVIFPAFNCVVLHDLFLK